MDDIDDSARRLDELYRAIGPQLLAYFNRRHRSRETAEDLLQETFAAIMRRPDGLFLAESPRAYLFGVARNLSIEAYRRSRPEEPLPPELAMEPGEQVDARLATVCDAIAKLNPASREVLELRLQPELTYAEIGAVLDIPIGTVRSRLHHAVKQLRHALNRSWEYSEFRL